MGNNVNKEKLLEMAKGHRQRDIISDLLKYGMTTPLKDYMTGTTHYNMYIRSFTNLINRLTATGLKVKMKMGKLGGYYTAYYYIES